MVIKNVSLRIEEDTIYKIKQIALDERKTQTQIIKEFLEDGIKKKEKE